LYGGAGNDKIYGGDGNDKAVGGAGNDSLLGGSGADTLSGAAGTDKVSGEAGKDVVAGGIGTDTITGGPDSDICNSEKGAVTCETFDTVSPSSISVKVIGSSIVKKSSAHPKISLEISYSDRLSGINSIGLNWAYDNGNGGAENYIVAPPLLVPCTGGSLPSAPVTKLPDNNELSDWVWANANEAAPGVGSVGTVNLGMIFSQADGWYYSCLKSGNIQSGVISSVWFFNKADEDFRSSPLGKREIKQYNVVDVTGNYSKGTGCHRADRGDGCDYSWPTGLKATWSLAK